MPSTRPRRARLSYTSLFQGLEDESADADPASASDFEPEEENSQGPPPIPDEDLKEAHGSDEVELIGSGGDEEGDDNHSVAFDTTPKAATRKPRRLKGKALMGGIQSTSDQNLLVLPFRTARQAARTATLSGLPSFNHRHRSTALFVPHGRTKRLIEAPNLFSPIKTILTLSVSDKVIADRVKRAWSLNVGKGPIWELLEDMAWWKEAYCIDSGEENRNLRPTVYHSVMANPGWEVINYETASAYLLNVSDSMSRPSISYIFGPLNSQTRVELSLFDHKSIREFFVDRTAHVFHAGGPVWGLDWCPRVQDEATSESFTQYLAVSTFPSLTYSPIIGSRQSRPFHSCIQIWSLTSSLQTPEDDEGTVNCEMILCVECGPVQHVKWCPLPTGEESSLRKLGILAAVAADGTLSFFSVPNPSDLEQRGSDAVRPIYVRLQEPLLRLEMEDTTFTSMDWANSETVCAGCANGSIAVFYVKDSLIQPRAERLYPTHYIDAHQSAIRDVTWIRAPPVSANGSVNINGHPCFIASAACDGQVLLTDIRETVSNSIMRSREMLNTICFSSVCGTIICIDQESGIKVWGLSPDSLGKGHGLFEPGGPVWSLDASDYHPILAVGSADGSCMTANMFRSTRRGSLAPHLIHKVFQIDYSPKLGEYRMLENILPFEALDQRYVSSQKERMEESLEGSTSKSTKDKGKSTKKSAEYSANLPWAGAWPREVGIHRVTWNSGGGLGNCQLLASGTASGLVRIDWLKGRFLRDKFPYESIEKLRGEVAGAGAAEDGESE